MPRGQARRRRPGRVYVHLLGKTDDPAAVNDLMCHEGIPGHVMAGDIQVRQTGTPKFRRAGGYVAFNEGWALYSEQLCKEMGAYPDVASDFMRLDAELFRAARLVSTPASMPRVGPRSRRSIT